MNPNAITPENARSFQARRKQLTQMATLKGLAREVGVEVDTAYLETIAAGAGTALENLVGHNYQTLMKSSNVRGQAESIRALMALLGVEKDEREVNHVHSMDTAALEALSELVRLLQPDTPETIEGATIADVIAILRGLA